jgi:streptogramin lyase
MAAGGDCQPCVSFVEFGTNQVGTIDSKTMQIREFPLPDPGARPRRIAIGPEDMVWYSDYARGFLGRLDPATGQAREWASPSGPKSNPGRKPHLERPTVHIATKSSVDAVNRGINRAII